MRCAILARLFALVKKAADYAISIMIGLHITASGPPELLA
jgi:hypothetical protein